MFLTLVNILSRETKAMKYKISYMIKDGDASKKHHRYYNALSSEIAKEMFKATKEESLIGEDTTVTAIYENTADKDKRYHWEEVDEEKKEIRTSK